MIPDSTNIGCTLKNLDNTKPNRTNGGFRRFANFVNSVDFDMFMSLYPVQRQTSAAKVNLL